MTSSAEFMMPNFKNKINNNICLSEIGNCNSINFCANPILIKKNSKNKVQKQELPQDLFFISMKHYDKNKSWAKEMNELAYDLSDMINKKASFDKIINTAERGVYVAYCDSETGYGIRKSVNDKWLYFIESGKRGEEYVKTYSQEFPKEDDYNKIIHPKANEEYKKANTCTIQKGVARDYYQPEYYESTIRYPISDGTNIKLAKKEYKKLLKTKNPNLDTILKSTATIHWLLTQETPWKRGTASIANLITKSIMHSYNIQLSPIKEGKSFDFEAFYRDLDDFIKVYPDLFQTKPYIRKDYLA